MKKWGKEKLKLTKACDLLAIKLNNQNFIDNSAGPYNIDTEHSVLVTQDLTINNNNQYFLLYIKSYHFFYVFQDLFQYE